MKKKKIMRIIDFHTYGPLYNISKSWLDKWKKTSMDKMDTLPTNINEDITCPHGGFIGSGGDVSKVPVEAWEYFATKFSHPDLVAHPNFQSKECEECSKAKEELEHLTYEKERERRRIKTNC